jgi:hypothetical protein
MKSRVLRLIAASLVLALGACAHVEPWERGTLARPDMAANPAPLQQQVRRHIYGSREAAPVSAGSGGGGGCGCY